MSSKISFVERSIMQARWVLPDPDLDEIEQIVRRFDLPEIIARLLCARGINSEEVESFLYPTLREHFPDPFSMVGMDEAASHVARAVQKQKNIAIFGDFDVDGATSSALLYRFLKHFGVEARIYIPQRLTEGYGPNTDALQKLKDDGTEVLLMLDCGTTAFEKVKAGREMGLDIIILDHHEAEDKLPAANHVINPKRKDDTSGLDMLAAVGVTFLFCVAVNSKLREAGRDEAPLKEWLDLVALGTVCDMVPLTHVNRLLVRYGFSQMNRTHNVGLKALIDVSGLDGPLSTYHAGFVLGPRINAGSRVHKSDLGARLLATDDAEEAKNIAWTLNDCNDKRKAIQAEMEKQAIDQVDEQGLDQYAAIIVDHEDWHAGLSGLVAGRLKEKYGKPSCVITWYETPDGRREGRGSGRSVPGIHVAQAFIDARTEGLLEKGGGHAMAGGFTVLPDKLEEFKAFMQAHIEKQAQSTETSVETAVDSLVTVRGVKPELLRMIEGSVGPFGQDYPEPLFLLQNVRLHSVDIVGDSHIRMMVGDWEGGSRMKAMAFRAVGTDLGEAFLKQGRQPFHLLGRLKLNLWQGRESVEMHVTDAAICMEAQEDRLASVANS